MIKTDEACYVIVKQVLTHLFIYRRFFNNGSATIPSSRIVKVKLITHSSQNHRVNWGWGTLSMNHFCDSHLEIIWPNQDIQNVFFKSTMIDLNFSIACC